MKAKLNTLMSSSQFQHLQALAMQRVQDYLHTLQLERMRKKRFSQSKDRANPSSNGEQS